MAEKRTPRSGRSKPVARRRVTGAHGASGGYKDGKLVTSDDFRRFWGVPTLLKAPLLDQIKDPTIGLIGVPFDGGIIRTPGARFGPRGVRNASFRVSNYNPEFDVVPHLAHRIADCGDILLSPFSIDDAYESIEKAVARLLARGMLPIAVGGDHSITTPILRALRQKHGRLALIQFDAHSDTSDTAYGHPHHHGSMFRRGIEEKLFDPSRMIQVGIRKHYYDTDVEFVREHRIEVITSRDLKDMGSGLRTTLARRFARLKGHKIFVTFDIDFLDQAYAPGTGGPEPFGPSSHEAIECVRALKSVASSIVGFDLVEVSPPLDVRDQTSVLAAYVLFEMVSILPPTVS